MGARPQGDARVTKHARWLRFHLLTLILVVLTGGVMLGLNMMEREGVEGHCILVQTSLYGWPLTCRGERVVTATFDTTVTEMRWYPGALLVDLLVAIVVMLVVGFVSEVAFFTRRGERTGRGRCQV